MVNANTETVVLNGFRVDLEHGPTSWGASSPDVPGCFAAGPTRDEALRLMGEALTEHVALLRELGMPVSNAAHLEDEVAA